MDLDCLKCSNMNNWSKFITEYLQFSWRKKIWISIVSQSNLIYLKKSLKCSKMKSLTKFITEILEVWRQNSWLISRPNYQFRLLGQFTVLFLTILEIPCFFTESSVQPKFFLCVLTCFGWVCLDLPVFVGTVCVGDCRSVSVFVCVPQYGSISVWMCMCFSVCVP